MGVCAVVMVRSGTGIAITDFRRQLERDEWGRFAITQVNDRFGWQAFDWEKDIYFSWQHGPRFRYLGFVDEDVDTGDHDCLDRENAYQLTFLKAMLAVERITGGPVYLGVDTIHLRSPECANECDTAFSLPPELDIWMPNWRQAEQIKVSNAGMVF